MHPRAEVSRIIRGPLWGTVLLLTAVAGSACLFGQSGSSPPASSARTNQPSSGPSQAAVSKTVWVVTPVGLNLRSAPGTTAQVVTILPWGAKLTISETQVVGADTWLHVQTDAGSAGWVQDSPAVVVHRSMSKHIESAYRHLYPSEWALQSGNPATLTSPTGDAEGITMTVATAADPAQLPMAPSSAGTGLGDDSAQTGDKTYILHSYKLNSGGFESFVSFKEGSTAYLFDFKQARGASPDTPLFRTILGSVLITGS
jgi:hypothetical protein